MEISCEELEKGMECLRLQIEAIKKLTKELEEQILKEELTREQDYYE